MAENPCTRQSLRDHMEFQRRLNIIRDAPKDRVKAELVSALIWTEDRVEELAEMLTSQNGFDKHKRS